MVEHPQVPHWQYLHWETSIGFFGRCIGRYSWRNVALGSFKMREANKASVKQPVACAKSFGCRPEWCQNRGYPQHGFPFGPCKNKKKRTHPNSHAHDLTPAEIDRRFSPPAMQLSALEAALRWSPPPLSSHYDLLGVNPVYVNRNQNET